MSSSALISTEGVGRISDSLLHKSQFSEILQIIQLDFANANWKHSRETDENLTQYCTHCGDEKLDMANVTKLLHYTFNIIKQKDSELSQLRQMIQIDDFSDFQQLLDGDKDLLHSRNTAKFSLCQSAESLSSKVIRIVESIKKDNLSDMERKDLMASIESLLAICKEIMLSMQGMASREELMQFKLSVAENTNRKSTIIINDLKMKDQKNSRRLRKKETEELKFLLSNDIKELKDELERIKLSKFDDVIKIEDLMRDQKRLCKENLRSKTNDLQKLIQLQCDQIRISRDKFLRSEQQNRKLRLEIDSLKHRMKCLRSEESRRLQQLEEKSKQLEKVKNELHECEDLKSCLSGKLDQIMVEKSRLHKEVKQSKIKLEDLSRKCSDYEQLYLVSKEEQEESLGKLEKRNEVIRELEEEMKNITQENNRSEKLLIEQEIEKNDMRYTMEEKENQSRIIREELEKELLDDYEMQYKIFESIMNDQMINIDKKKFKKMQETNNETNIIPKEIMKELSKFNPKKYLSKYEPCLLRSCAENSNERRKKKDEMKQVIELLLKLSI